MIALPLKRRISERNMRKRFKSDSENFDTRLAKKNNTIKCVEDSQQYRISFESEQDVTYDTIDDQFIVTINELPNIFPLKQANLKYIDITNNDKNTVIKIPKI